MQRYLNVVQDNAGNALSGVSVTVNLTGTATLATLYSDNGVTPKVNPFTNDSDGTVEFYTSDGRYDIVYAKTGYTFVANNTTDILFADPSASGFTLTAPVINGTYSVSSGTVLSTGSSTARSLATRFAEQLNVRDYGATGDGTTDDTAAFQAVADLGGTIWIPEGTYVIDYVTLSNSSVWRGEGIRTVLKKKDNSVSTTYTGNYYSYMFNVINPSRTYEFHNFSFDGNYYGQTTTRTGDTAVNTGVALGSPNNYNGAATVLATGGFLSTLHMTAPAASDSLRLRFRDCRFCRFVTIALYIQGTIDSTAYAELDVTGCVFDTAGPTIVEYHDGVSVYDGIVYPASGYSFSVSGSSATGIYIIDNAKARISNNLFHETRDPYAGTLTTGYEANTTNLPMCGIVITVFDGTTQNDPLDWSDVSITNNRFIGMGRNNVSGNGIGIIDFYTRLANASISNNVFLNAYGDAIRGKANAKNLSIVGNVIETENRSAWTARGINFGGATYAAQRGNYVIANNVISGMRGGIDVFGTTTPPENSDPDIADDPDNAANNVVITGNVIHDMETTSLANAVMGPAFNNDGWGIYVFNLSGVVISNNVIDTLAVSTTFPGDQAESGIRVVTCINGLSITGNTITTCAASGIAVTDHVGQVVVADNVIEACDVYGIFTESTGEVVITGNNIKDTNATGILTGSSVSVTVLVADNIIKDVVADTANTIGGISTGSASSLVSGAITGNIITNVSNAGAGPAYGIVATMNSTPSDNNTINISGNTIDTTEQSGMILTDVSGMVVQNIFKNVNTAADTAHGAIFVNGVTNQGKTIFRDNSVEGTTMFPSSGGASYSTVHEVTIATGAVTINLNDGAVLIDTESDAATDDLDTINGTQDGQIITCRAISSARDVVFKDGTGNMRLAGDFTANNLEDTITLRNSNGTLYEMSRSDNGA